MTKNKRKKSIIGWVYKGWDLRISEFGLSLPILHSTSTEDMVKVKLTIEEI